MAAWTGVLQPPTETPVMGTQGPQTATLYTSGQVSVYKMKGYYTTGSVWEVWVSNRAPNLNPPSGHTLVNVSYLVLGS